MATILITDERANHREGLATLLGYAGHHVLHARDGSEALELAKSLHPDLVITDILTPTMGGADFADHVHDEPSIAHTPIIFYTASYRIAEARVLAHSCRAAAVLAKPAEPQDIFDAVAGALGVETVSIPIPDSEYAQSSMLDATLPEYLLDLTGLQRRLRRTLNRAVEDAESRRAAATESDAIAYSFHSLSLRLATLVELDIALSSERQPQAMLALFCSAAQDILNCKYVAVGILDSDGSRLQMFASRGMDELTEKLLAATTPTAELLNGIIASGVPHRVNEQGGDSTTLGLPLCHPPISSLLAVPIPSRSASPLIGWVYFADKFGAQLFDDEDEQFAVTLAMQLSVAYGNLALYEEIQQHAEELENEVQERRRAQADLAHSATHDQTTGLPRFALVERHLQLAFVDAAAHQGRVTLLYVDIDRFHAVNETRGHAVGDDVLRILAERLKTACGVLGYVAHVSADEFVVVRLDAEGAPDPCEFAEALRRGIEEPIHYGDQRIYLTCSIGTSCFPDNGTSPQELLRQAEAAMLRSKRDGRNTVTAFCNGQKQALEDRLKLGLRLSDAIRDGQLTMHYQPQVDARDLRILGFEALVRWQSPEFGLLLPGRFLDVAEDLGLIVDVGNFVLDSVCRQACAWLAAGETDFSISINVSSLQMQRPDFVDQVREALSRSALPARHIELELTENMMACNVERMIDTMKALKALDVRLAMDDFGTGYSSLKFLRRFPIDKLKIDQSFVQDINSDASAAGVCRAVIALGHQLGMIVVAEGVETELQANYLRKSSCDQFQGFYFGRPMPAPRALEMLRSRRMAMSSAQ